MSYTVFIVSDATKTYQPIKTVATRERAEHVKATYEKIYPELNIIIEKEKDNGKK